MGSVVVTSCLAFLSHDDCVASIHPEKIEAFLASIKQDQYERIVQREKAMMTFPLDFISQHQKWNFYCILHLLNFGSGYRTMLKNANGYGAFDNIIKLLMAAYISGCNLDAQWMMTIEASTIAEFMSIDMVTEIPVKDNPILHQLEPSPAAELVQLITKALRHTGQELQRLGKYPYLIDFIIHSTKSGDNIDTLLGKLAQLSVLNDRVALDDGSTVFIYKKMQVMLSELARNGLAIACIGPGDLTIFSDNVIPTMLNHFGLVSCPTADTALRSGIEITPIQALSVRAASVVICRQIVEKSYGLHMPWIGNEVDLDNYLWKVAKEPEYRILPRYTDRSTWFY